MPMLSKLTICCRDKVQNAAHQSRPVDLDQVASRLHDISNNCEPHRRSRSPSYYSPPLSTGGIERLDLQREDEAHRALVEAGCRPPYPYHLLKDIILNPEKYLEDPTYRDIIIYSQWYSSGSYHLSICEDLLSRWEAFCKLQRIIRERSVKDEWALHRLSNYVTWESYPVKPPSQTEGTWGFSEYAETTKKRLAKYGFTQPFQLERDLLQQDTMTTWIEFLACEYRDYDRPASYVKDFEPRHDEAWKKLVDSGLLSPGETYETVNSVKDKFKRWGEEKRAIEALQSATEAVQRAEQTRPQGSEAVQRAHQHRFLEAQSALNTAKAAYEPIKRRDEALGEFLDETFRYREEKRWAEGNYPLLRWIQQQLPLIELELNSSRNDDKDTSHMENEGRLRIDEGKGMDEEQHFERQTDEAGDTVQTVLAQPTLQGRVKRKRHAEPVNQQRPSKGLKETSQDGPAKPSTPELSDTAGETVDASAGTKVRANKVKIGKGNRTSLPESSQVAKPLRRSARIAQQVQNAAKSVQKPPSSSPIMPNKIAKTKRAGVEATERSRQGSDRQLHAAKDVSKRGRSLQVKKTSKKTSKPRGTPVRRSR